MPGSSELFEILAHEADVRQQYDSQVKPEIT
jgi:hypothetical protein